MSTKSILEAIRNDLGQIHAKIIRAQDSLLSHAVWMKGYIREGGYYTDNPELNARLRKLYTLQGEIEAALHETYVTKKLAERWRSRA